MFIHFSPEEVKLIKAYKDAMKVDSVKDAVMNVICLAFDYINDPAKLKDPAYNDY